MDPEIPLKGAQKLAIIAENEPDPISQELIYLDGILCLVLCGNLMENNGSTQKAVFKRYNDIFDSIKVIWSRIYKYRADCNFQLDEIYKMPDDPEKDNRMLIIWMRCLSFLRLKLYNLFERKNNQCLKNTQQHYNNVDSNPISQSPSPASVGEARSLEYICSSCSAGIGSTSDDPNNVTISTAAYNSLRKLAIQTCHLSAVHKLSLCIDKLIMQGKHRQFFAEIDESCGPLTESCTVHQLVQYAHVVISRLRCEFNIKNYF